LECIYDLHLAEYFDNELSQRTSLFWQEAVPCSHKSGLIDFIKTSLSTSKDCENHGGGCEGPVFFSMGTKKCSKCGHYFNEARNAA
jgi:hypothetical protein